MWKDRRTDVDSLTHAFSRPPAEGGALCVSRAPPPRLPAWHVLVPVSLSTRQRTCWILPSSIAFIQLQLSHLTIVYWASGGGGAMPVVLQEQNGQPLLLWGLQSRQ